MQEPTKFWDGVAAKYAKSPIKDMKSYEDALGRTRSYLSPSDKVLELGCGTGSTALLLAGDCAEIIATDISSKMLQEGQRKASDQNITNVSFVQAATSDLPEGPFDVVMAFNLMHLVRDTGAALARVHKCLKPGGLLISKTPCRPISRPPLGYRLILMVLPLMQWVGKAPFVKFMGITDWDAEVANAGFEIIETGNYPANPPSRYIVARKQ